ncbi:lysozyme inhibitor LprI family protein [Xanthomonas sacchari]|uniref:lysozyme inhibitor LprI family protein n=1 Tax=Xanthomonas sacchari TaxID=56458 RepID=UPI00225E48E5|nr:lysozyme inhibitor LprI family protein [Xanthomonas sacchari]UYK80923.1 lysozyme inhibitor LprI family protein [Xanthomonas sacchari]
MHQHQGTQHQRRLRAWLIAAVVAAVCGNAAAQQMDPRDAQLQQQQRLLQQQAQQIQQMQQQLQQMPPAGAEAAAPRDGLSATYHDCRKQAQGLDESRRCIQREQRVQQERLDRAYDKLRYRISGTDRSRLMDAQYTWQQSNEQAAQLDRAFGARGQEAGLQSAEATLRRISSRADELEGYTRGGR